MRIPDEVLPLVGQPLGLIGVDTYEHSLGRLIPDMVYELERQMPELGFPRDVIFTQTFQEGQYWSRVESSEGSLLLWPVGAVVTQPEDPCPIPDHMPPYPIYHYRILVALLKKPTTEEQWRVLERYNLLTFAEEEARKQPCGASN